MKKEKIAYIHGYNGSPNGISFNSLDTDRTVIPYEAMEVWGWNL